MSAAGLANGVDKSGRGAIARDDQIEDGSHQRLGS